MNYIVYNKEEGFGDTCATLCTSLEKAHIEKELMCQAHLDEWLSHSESTFLQDNPEGEYDPHPLIDAIDDAIVIVTEIDDAIVIVTEDEFHASYEPVGFRDTMFYHEERGL